MLLGLDRLAENGVATVVLFFHGASSFVKIVEHFWLDRGDMGNYRLAFGINFQYRAAAWAGQIETAFLGHLSKSYRKVNRLSGDPGEWAGRGK